MLLLLELGIIGMLALRELKGKQSGLGMPPASDIIPGLLRNLAATFKMPGARAKHSAVK
jgi:hypothetical protein